MTVLRRTPVRLGGVLAVALLAIVLTWVVTDRTPAMRTVASLGPAAPVAQLQLTRTVAPAFARPAPAVPHDAVAPAAPTAFRITGAAFDISAKVCGMNNVRPLDPPGEQYHTVCWVQEGFGVAPGTNSGGTSYILGHSWAEAPLVLTQLSVTAMNAMDMAAPQTLTGVATYPTAVLNGYQIQLTTPNGLLTYTVDTTYAVSKSQAASVGPLMAESTPNRLVIITCGVHDGRDIDVNIIVDATLTSSQKA